MPGLRRVSESLRMRADQSRMKKQEGKAGRESRKGKQTGAEHGISEIRSGGARKYKTGV